MALHVTSLPQRTSPPHLHRYDRLRLVVGLAAPVVVGLVYAFS